MNKWNKIRRVNHNFCTYNNMAFCYVLQRDAIPNRE